MGLHISQAVRLKLSSKNPPVSEEDIQQCFANRTGKDLLDQRAEHATDPATRWFVSQTDFGRTLKVCYIPYPEDIAIRTAYDANPDEIRIYRKYGEPNDEIQQNPGQQ